MRRTVMTAVAALAGVHWCAAVYTTASAQGNPLAMVNDAILAVYPPDQSLPRNADRVEFDNAKKAVVAILKDPESARFDGFTRKQWRSARGEVIDLVCGNVNSKNSFGGYTGSTLFSYGVQAKRAVLAEGSDPKPTLVARYVCDWWGTR